MDRDAIQARVRKAVLGALRAWGAAAQWRMVQEECAELIAQINRVDRGRGSQADLAEEVADVIICISQARVLVGEALVDDAAVRKLQRLEERIARAGERPL